MKDLNELVTFKKQKTKKTSLWQRPRKKNSRLTVGWFKLVVGTNGIKKECEKEILNETKTLKLLKSIVYETPF